jgi:predicted nucleic acid-binding protein
VALVVVDTDIASKLFRDQLPASWVDRLGKQQLAVSFVTIGEAVYGAQRRRWGVRQIARLERFYGYEFVAVPSRGQQVPRMAKAWGGLRVNAERTGFTMPVNDAWIAATCLALGYPLATLNRKHFEPLAAFGLDLL